MDGVHVIRRTEITFFNVHVFLKTVRELIAQTPALPDSDVRGWPPPWKAPALSVWGRGDVGDEGAPGGWYYRG